jgi:aminoglycoside phosphotransferase (APT) family kinase protein
MVICRASYNEALRQAERYLRFSVQELKRLVAECINQKTEDVVLFKKLAEGGFNRVFQISMRDGFRLVARIPYPTTAPKSFAVASEVATMDFLRSHGIPVPKVYAYSATSDNAVGVEYIIMEMLEGRQIGDYWYSMTEEERLKITFQVARIEGELFSIPLPASGSIYYSHDLEPSIQRLGLSDCEESSRFCIGPATNLKLWYRERSALSVYRGPCES